MRAIQLQMFNDFQRNVGQNEQISEESKAWHKDQHKITPSFHFSFCQRRSFAFLLQNTVFIINIKIILMVVGVILYFKIMGKNGRETRIKGD